MFDVFIMDMGGHDENLVQLKCQLPHAQTMRYLSTHLDMVKRASTKSRTEFFWVISSCCDYANFDFNYIPVPWEQTQIHCWASGTQKFGDTFLVPRDAFRNAIPQKLEWYQHVNYHSNGVARLPWPTSVFSNDLAVTVKATNFNSLYHVFVSCNTTIGKQANPNLWENRPLIAYNKTGHVSMCPRDVKVALNDQLYDWPNIQYHTDENSIQKPQDIVFISYDEENAESHWQDLSSRFPHAKRVHRVKGLLNALKQAATTATTDWFYAVFAKTKVVGNFNFDFQPDYLRKPANYVFQAYNPVLNHSYGHDGVVLHHRDSLLQLEHVELDITMSMPVVSVPVISCINNYTETPWAAFRTAFREAYKLKRVLMERPSIDDEYHLHLWLTSNAGVNGSWSQLGAAKGYEAVDIVINDWDAIKVVFDQTATEVQQHDQS